VVGLGDRVAQEFTGEEGVEDRLYGYLYQALNSLARPDQGSIIRGLMICIFQAMPSIPTSLIDPMQASHNLLLHHIEFGQ